eukprot:4802236-Amphidinium_carterae.1
MMTPECVEAMATPEMAGSSKINSTLAHQTPETSQRWHTTLNRIKAQWRTEFMAEMKDSEKKESEKKETGKQTTTTVNIELGSEDE